MIFDMFSLWTKFHSLTYSKVFDGDVNMPPVSYLVRAMISFEIKGFE